MIKVLRNSLRNCAFKRYFGDTAEDFKKSQTMNKIPNIPVKDTKPKMTKAPKLTDKDVFTFNKTNTGYELKYGLINQSLTLLSTDIEKMKQRIIRSCTFEKVNIFCDGSSQNKVFL